MQQKKKIVLILTPFFRPNIGGVETHLDDLCGFLSNRKGIYVVVVTYTPLVTKRKAKIIEKRNNLCIIRIPWFGFDLFHKLLKYPALEMVYLMPPLLLVAFVTLLLKFRSIAVIHSQGIVAGFIGFVLAIFFGKKHIISIHAIYEINSKGNQAHLYRLILNSAEKVLALSDASKRELFNFGVSPQKIERYYYWVNQENFKPVLNRTVLRNEFGCCTEFVVLFVGRFLPIKGIDLLLEIAGELREEEIIFLWIGDGPLTEKIRNSCGKNSKMRFLGKIENQELWRYYNTSDILCVPSQYEEGYGRVILEALSCGLPVIASKRGGIPEIINENVGILCEPQLESLKSAILKLYKDKALRTRLSENAVGYSREKFSDNNGEIIFKTYGIINL